jgi:DNA polymerase V
MEQTVVVGIRQIRRGARTLLPLFYSPVRAGFPSPADDHVEKRIDISALLVTHKASTFFVSVRGDSMTDSGICSGDSLVVDRSLKPVDGSIVIAAYNGHLVVKRLRSADGRVFLASDNPAYPPIEVTDHCDLVIWGVVTFSIHSHQSGD